MTGCGLIHSDIFRGIAGKRDITFDWFSPWSSTQYSQPHNILKWKPMIEDVGHKISHVQKSTKNDENVEHWNKSA